MEDFRSIIWLLGKGHSIVTHLDHPAPGLSALVEREQWVGTGPTSYCYVFPAREAAIVIDYAAREGAPEEAPFRRLVEAGHSCPVEFAAALSPTACVDVNVCRAIVRRKERPRFERWARELLGKETFAAIRAQQP